MAPSRSSDPGGSGNRKGRSYRPFLYLLICLLLASPASADSRSRLELQFDSSNYSEPTSLKSLGGEWDRPIGDGNRAWSMTRWLLGYRTAGYSLQLLQRDDSYYRFDNETAVFIHRIENHLPLETGRRYRLMIEPDRVTTRGLRLGLHRQPREQVSVSAYLSLLQPTHLLQGKLQGSATALAPNDYDFRFDSDLLYHRDPLFERPGRMLSGLGYAIDLQAAWQPAERWKLSAEWLDAQSELRIDRAGHTSAEATSDTKQYDADGYLTYDPAVTGTEDSGQASYRFTSRLRLSLTAPLTEAIDLELEHRIVQGYAWQQLALTHSLGQGRISWKLMPRLEAFGIGYAREGLSLSIVTDRLRTGDMRFLELQIAASWVL